MKLLAAIFGFFIFGPIGALIGWFAGSILQRYVNFGSGGMNPFTEQQRSENFRKTLFQLAGSIAKADGKVSQDEINLVEKIIMRHAFTLIANDARAY